MKNKTLIINGSPRKKGNSAYISNFFLKKLNGEVCLVEPYFDDIKACTDCGFCAKGRKCIFDDNMSRLYEYICEADNIIFISPLYYSMLTGGFLNFASRLQYFYMNKDELKPSPKNGYVLLIGGGTTKDTSHAIHISKLILRGINAEIKTASSYINTDRQAVWENEDFLNEVKEIAEDINK